MSSRREFIRNLGAGTVATAVAENPASGKLAGAGTAAGQRTWGCHCDMSALTIGSQKQLFIDDYILHDRYNVAKVLHQAKKLDKNPILVPDQPWELSAAAGYIESVFIHYEEQEKLYKLWYMEYPTKFVPIEKQKLGAQMRDVIDRTIAEERQNFCLAVSRDLIHWEKPHLGIVEYRGSKQNNLFHHEFALMIFQDPDDPDPRKRYKGITRDGDEEKGYVYIPEYSPDGLHWTADREHPLPHNIRDDAIAPYVDKQLVNGLRLSARRSRRKAGGADVQELPLTPDVMGKYVWIRRVWNKGTGGAGGRRVVGISRSDDFLHWSPNDFVIFQADERDHEEARNLGADHAELYEFRSWPYEGIWVGFLHVFSVLDPVKIGGCRGPIDMQLAFSRDGYYWQRAFDREPILPRGGLGEWDAGMIYRTSVPHIVGDEIWIHYNGFRDRHGAPYEFPPGSVLSGIGLAKLRLDGFVSLEGPEQGGVVTTKPLVFTGRHLVLNADAAKGAILVEIFADGKPVRSFTRKDCDAVKRDAVRHVVSWCGSKDVSALAGREVQLKFYMWGSQLYSFVFR